MEMEVEEPWEALDVDDTDLSSSASTSTSVSQLRRCNHQRRLSNLPSQPYYQSHSPPPTLQQPPSTTTRPPRRIISGPAGAIQAAMHRHFPSHSNSNSKQPLDISTQEYIRRVQEDAGEEFSRHPWVFALNHGVVDTNTTPLSAITNSLNPQRFDKVVAIVKSCTPNGLGDMMITLKDPSGTISASVHGKVLSIGEFGKLLTVGSVLILKKVVAFSSSCTSCYLNITRSNIAKVISVDCEVQLFPEANLDSTPVTSTKAVAPEKTSTLVSSRSERVVRDENRCSSSKGKAIIEELTGKEKYSQLSSLNYSRQIRNVADKNFREPIHIDLVDSRQSDFGCNSKQQGHNSGITRQPCPGSLEGIVGNFQDNREFSSAPSIIENLANRNCQANSIQVERLLPGNNCSMRTTEKAETVVEASRGTSSRMPKNAGANDAQNLGKREISEMNGNLKSLQQTETEEDDQEPRGANEVKKQRLALISRTAIQEWTDEQLCILDMDED